ncbi:YesL family protein [Roseibium salinum]|uniref:YesL family protein n=1 Tax=Roseibium salinum TaxID=1604349 RepID=A0ABT3QXC9_9HYPH|nr:YesL family protein [Roseibium sp. DSM 29163]MCX2721496.1 YesL family protein [Roseibium sp. DSM 29163]
MNWFLNHYFDEGPGIPKDAPRPEGLRLLASTFGREWWELLKLNLLFLAFCLPVVTLPAAYYAMVRISLTMIEDRNVYLWRDFWSAFRSRFWMTTALGILFAGGEALALLAARTYAQASLDQIAFSAPLAVSVTVAVLLPLYAAHLFVARALGEDRSFSGLAKAAAIGLLARPLPGIAALGFVALLWLAHILFYPASALLPVLVNFSLGALVTSFAVLEGVRHGLSVTGPALNPKQQEDRKQSAEFPIRRMK